MTSKAFLAVPACAKLALDRLTLLIVALTAITLMTTRSAAAQAPPIDGARPGQIDRELKEPPQPKSELPVRPDAAAEPPAAPAAGRDLRFVLHDIVADGVTLYAPGELAGLYAPYLDREVSLRDLDAIAAAIAARYEADGHPLTRVRIPVQAVDEGIVHLTVVEGVIHHVYIRGGRAESSPIVAGHVERIQQSRPLRTADLERSLLLINDLGGVFAQATLARSDEYGGSDLVVDVSERRFGSSVGFENRGSRLLGPYRADLEMQLYSMFGEYASTELRFTTSGRNRELNFGSLSHSAPLGSSGLTLQLSGTIARSRPGLEDVRGSTLRSEDELDTDSWSGSIGLSYPALRSRASNLTLRLNLTASEGDTDFLASRLSEDKLRAVRSGFTFDFVDRLGAVNLVDTEVSHGFDVFGASNDRGEGLSRRNGRTRFTKANVYLARLQPLGGRFSILLASTGQYAFDKLLSPEGFGYGGEQFGRAFDASELFGDTGVAFKSELRFAGGNQGRYFGAYTLYLFYDAGQIRRRSPGPGEERRENAASLGTGIRFDITRQLSGYLELAQPMASDVKQEADRHARIFFGLSVHY